MYDTRIVLENLFANLNEEHCLPHSPILLLPHHPQCFLLLEDISRGDDGLILDYQTKCPPSPIYAENQQIFVADILKNFTHLVATLLQHSLLDLPIFQLLQSITL